MSLDINKVIMEATSSMFETTKATDDKGDKAQTPADKNSYHVGADKAPGEPTSATVAKTKEVTENKEVIEDKEENKELVTEAGKVKVGKGESPYDAEIPKDKSQSTYDAEIPKDKSQSTYDADNPTALQTIGRKASRAVGTAVHGTIDAIKQEPIASGTAAAIAAGLGAVALAKKLRKEKKKSTLVKTKS